MKPLYLKLRDGSGFKLYQIYISVFVIIFLIPKLLFAGQLRVVRVTDGDSIKAKINGMEINVRLVGIDAPELGRKKNEPG